MILNYVVAYQALHRSARVKAGDKVLLDSLTLKGEGGDHIEDSGKG